MGSISELLSKHTIGELPAPANGIIEVQSTATLEEAFTVLSQHNILSVPVFDPAAGTYIGFLDTRDLIAFAVFATEEDLQAARLASGGSCPGVMPAQPSTSIDRLIAAAGKSGFSSSTATQGGHLAQSSVSVACASSPAPAANPVFDLPNLARRNPFRSLPADAPLLEAACILGNASSRRLAQLGPDGRVCKMISQSLILKFIDNNLSKVPKFANLVCYLKNRSSLLQDIMSFLKTIRQAEIEDRAPVFSCHPHHTVGHVVRLLSATRAHRLFVVDAKQAPLRVVSIRDVLKLALDH
ncbi:hypothetical protein H696_04858 [Fonticula alba]|uniref:CBS domain-containing protein n=1 Tax=Fonticula alba TaxID=691883 RepID=A0A058Z2U2_FONAL|nr:hypothetical protein H696_04858 [Fonticula alba]KCV68565.1 hypothetical protein H696_04858 [Fonticula alba]|eukprot:XP_009496997.1 hypothetical protein H696_04858 [Fonticula alba]